MSKAGDYFLRFETYQGSGEKGCVGVFRRGRRHPGSHLTRVRWLAHTCGKTPRKSVSMAIEFFEANGELIWIKS